MTHFLIFYGLLAAACGYALLAGDRDSRVVAGVCCIATLLSHVAVRPAAVSYSATEFRLFAVDVLTLAAFTLVALSSRRFWPLWIAGLQLTTLVSHFLRQLDGSLVPRAYALAAIFWSYPILLILAIATWRAKRRQGKPGKHWQAAS